MSSPSLFQRLNDRVKSVFLKNYKKLFYWHLNRKDFQYFKFLRKAYYEFDETRLYEWKYSHLKKLLEFSVEHVPYYRELFEKQHINVNNIKDLETFEETVPLLNRKIIQENFDKFKADVVLYPPFIKNSTGGSTGQPLNFLQDNNTLSYHGAATWLQWSWMGWKPWEKRAYLWGADRDLKKKQSAQKKWDTYVSNAIFLNSFNMDKKKMLLFRNRLLSFRPKILIGYANSLYLFSKLLLDNNLSFEEELFPIQSSAEVLTEDMRSVIEKAFNSRVFNSYGSREISTIAHECEDHSGLHVNEFLHHLELVPLQDSGSYKKVVLTDFTNFIFPFIRYENGDLSEFANDSRCRCGRIGRKLSKIVGRKTDFIKTPSGKIIHGEYFTHLLYGQHIIRDFQVVQEEPDKIRIYYVLLNEEDPQGEERLKDYIKEKIYREIDPSLEITFEKTSEIEKTKTGKNKFVISLLKDSEL